MVRSAQEGFGNIVSKRRFGYFAAVGKVTPSGDAEINPLPPEGVPRAHKREAVSFYRHNSDTRRFCKYIRGCTGFDGGVEAG